MDNNKLKVLQAAGYQIRVSCGLCQHGVFQGRGMFGTCAVMTYRHGKHTGPERQLSVNRYGRCVSKFELADVAAGPLAAWLQFLDEGEE